MKKKLLIAGATGFIGRNMVEYFAQKEEFEVHAIRFNREEYQVKNVIWHKVDLRNPDQIEKVIPGIDIIIQAAATTSGAKDIVSKPYIHVTDNAVMNSYLFRLAFEHKVKHVIFFSCTVMYQSSEKALKESDFDANKELHPRYFGVGNTKLYIEKMCDFYSRIGETKFTAIRHSNIYGPHDKYDFNKCHVTPATIRKVADKMDPIPVWGDGSELRDLLYVSDFVDALQIIMENEKEMFEVYNVGSNKVYSVLEVLDLMKTIAQHDAPIEFISGKPSMIPTRKIDSNKIKEKLGWEAKTSLTDGLSLAYNWYNDNKDEFNK